MANRNVLILSVACVHVHDSSSHFTVDAILIDGLGVQHYVDRETRKGPSSIHTEEQSASKDEKANRKNTRDCEADDPEHGIASLLRTLLHKHDVFCMVSKCALYQPVSFSTAKQAVGRNWPTTTSIPPPKISQEFMPSVWTSLVDATIVTYTFSCKLRPKRHRSPVTDQRADNNVDRTCMGESEATFEVTPPSKTYETSHEQSMFQRAIVAIDRTDEQNLPCPVRVATIEITDDDVMFTNVCCSCSAMRHDVS